MAYNLSPVLNEQQFDANGEPRAGGLITTYLAQSLTLVTTYKTSTGTAHTNPIQLDSSGNYPNGTQLWLLGGLTYKFVITDSDGSNSRTYEDISGIGDNPANADEWILYGATPTYISATSFSVIGDQTNTFQVNRRLKSANTGGTVYSTITASVFLAGVTTVTVVNTSGILDAGLSAVSYGLLSATNPSVPASYALLASPIFTGDPTAPQAADGDADLSLANTAYVQSAYAAVRQTVLSGPVDTNGFAAFGGATGSGTVTATGTLIASAANGVFNRRGSITNPSWTGLTTNGTMYLYLDIAQGGACTTGSGTLVPTDRNGGADVVTNGQFTFNIQEMQGKVGNGATAVQTYRVYAGQVTVAGGVVTAIVWYQLMGRYSSVLTAIRTAAGADTFTHNLGFVPRSKKWVLVNTTTEANWAVGDEYENPVIYSAGAEILSSSPITGRLTATHIASASVAGNIRIYNKTTFAVVVGITAGSWRYRIDLERGW